MTPLEILNTIYGYGSFRDQQEAIIDSVCEGKDALVLMPTGGGKSLCYQIPAIYRQGVGIVISPLIALMQDQVDALLQLGVKAAFLNSSLGYDEAWNVEQQLLKGELDLLYVAPERLVTDSFMSLLRKIPLALFAIDEAHCVSQWGHDFRPEYLKLQCLHEQFPQVPRIALTATADARTQKEIIQKLKLEDAEVFLSSFNRPNIYYQVDLKENPHQQIVDFIQQEHRGEAGIVYCLSRKKVEATALWLNTQGIQALPYHAGLPANQREQHQRRFLREEGMVMVATIAFGMGIDKPDVRFVAHLDLPKSMESYYQETGRAGRDGLPAVAWMCYSLADVISLRRLMSQSEAPPEVQRADQQRLNSLLAYCETHLCRRKVILEYFDEMEPVTCNHCDNCLNEIETWNATVEAQKAMSCIFKCGQTFGSHHIVDVLLGESNEKILSLNHDQLSTYGIGKEHDRNTWLSVIRQLALSGYLSIDPSYGSLSLSGDYRPLLKGETQISLRKDVRAHGAKRSRPKAAITQGNTTLSSEQAILYEELRTWRLQRAEEQNAPPYVIATDSLLKDLSCYMPQNNEELLLMNGIGKQKSEKYGSELIQMLQQHPKAFEQRKTITDAVETRSARGTRRESTPRGATVALSIAMFQNGSSIEAIAKERSLNPMTVSGHLAKAVENGEVPLEKVCPLSKEEIESILHFMSSIPTDGPFLRTLHDHFEGKYEFDVLRFVQAHRIFSSKRR